MDITRERCADGLNVIVKGRLDGYWADHLAKELAEVLREGVHEVRLDLSGVNYLSSAGLGTPGGGYKEIKKKQGAGGPRAQGVGATSGRETSSRPAPM